ncbi:sigma-70 family RNA polymerase sigma factor, partial [Salinibacterium sp.]|uniref:sigma-70 family RNA polymerase sigma factor n=1 Tax=Salinibacterium sp. TaxID=1915057 RepID=UPI00286D4532
MGRGVDHSAERSDAELISAVRAGDSGAHSRLFARHSGPALRVARAYSRDAFAADDLVSEAFDRTIRAIQGGRGPDLAFRAYLYTTLRRLSAEQSSRDARVQATDDISAFERPTSSADPAVASFENRVVNSAFASLPERWQEALWYLEVERMSPADVAPILGLTANGVSALGFRAREGLRQAYLQEHVVAVDTECADVRGRLGAYSRDGLAKRETLVVESHLDDCSKCGAILVELRDVGHGMRVVIAPLVLGSAGAAALLGLGHAPAASAAVLVPRWRLHRPSGRAVAAVAATVVGLAGAAVAAAMIIPTLSSVDVAAPVAQPPTAQQPAPVSPPTATPPPSASPTTPPTPPPPLAPLVDPSARPAPRQPALAAPPANPIPALPPSISLAWEDTGDLVLGRNGLIGVVVTNTGASPVAALTVSIDLPAGVTVDLPRTALMGPPTGWSCVPVGAVVTCSIPSFAHGATVVVRIPLAVGPAADTVTALRVSARAGAVELAAAAAAPVRVAGFGATVILDGAYTIRVAGASLLDCDGSPGCVDARARVGLSSRWDNNDWVMSEAGTSTTRLDLPPGATVAVARVYWSAYVPSGASAADLGGISLSAPGAAAVTVVADRTDRTLIGARNAYQSSADITTLVATGGGGNWGATGAPLVTGTNTYAGWV